MTPELTIKIQHFSDRWRFRKKALEPGRAESRALLDRMRRRIALREAREVWEELCERWEEARYRQHAEPHHLELVVSSGEGAPAAKTRGALQPILLRLIRR